MASRNAHGAATPHAEPHAAGVRPPRLPRGHRASAPRGVSAATLPGRALDGTLSARPPRSSGIGYLAEDRRTFSVFAEHGGPGFLPPTERYTTDLERPARFPVADSPLAVVFDGDVLCVRHLRADPRFVNHADELRAAGLESGVFVPLMIGSRVIGELSAASRDRGRLRRRPRRAAAQRRAPDRPFIEMIAGLYRERRQRPGMELLTGITQMLGTTSTFARFSAPLGEAVRPAIDFDTMGVILLNPAAGSVRSSERSGEPPAPGVRHPDPRVLLRRRRDGRPPVLFDEASRGAGPALCRRSRDVRRGLQTCLWVPMQFGDEVGGTLFFGKHEPHWYDGVDVEVATVIANGWSSGSSTSGSPRISDGSRPSSAGRGRSSRA